jgi:geranylgeranyl pyrophosphate synthase
MEDPAIATRLKDLLQDGRRLTDEEARQVASIVRASDAPQRALAMAQGHAETARRQLDGVEPGTARDSLMTLAGYVVTRKL